MGQRWIFYGESGTGKTFDAVQNLALLKEVYPDIIVALISPNYESDETWQEAERKYRQRRRRKLVDIHYRDYNDQTISWLNKIIDRRMDYGSGRKRRGVSPYAIVGDDLGELQRINTTYVDNPFKKISISSRHLKVIAFMIYQKVSQALKIFANNVQMIVCKRIDDEDENNLFRKRHLADHSKTEYKRLCALVFQRRYDSMVIDRRDPYDVKIYRNFDEPVRIRERNVEVL